eukprot:CCRYP_018700-RA/>CCRYP_018700-RA protein AED:0.44 eAED:0.35 QI:0/0/0/1/0/0/2/0/271
MLTATPYGPNLTRTTKGELILACNRALQRMKACGIQPTRQVLDNKISTAYKLAITTSGMTYQLVPPADHRRNIAEKAIQTWKDHFIAINFPSTFGANYYQNGAPTLSSTAINAYPTFPLIRISDHHDYNTHPLVPWAWKPLSHDKPHRVNLLPNTAPKGMSSAHPTSTTAAGKYGHQPAHHPYLCHSFLQTQVHHQPLCHPCRRNHSSHCKPISSTHKQSQAHHNNKVNQSDLTRLQILTQPSPPHNTMQHTLSTTLTKATHRPHGSSFRL